LRGERTGWVIFREILPNISGPVVVEGTVRLGYAIFTASSLSFLQLGPQDPSPDWGLNIAENLGLMQTQWWTLLFPALAIATLVVGINLVADSLRQETR
jgi:peptide/nickel transport system permease protein